MNGLEASKGRTLEQCRAKFALEKIQQLSQQKDKAKEAALYIRRLPAMTFGNGLGQALAFLLAKAEGKKDNPARHVYDIVSDWLIRERKIYPENGTDLLESMMNNNRDKYMIAQEEAWALLDWLKKFADALLPTEEESETAAGKGA
jgi:CRISPR-associated protein Cmr5